jgi:DNA primase
VSVVDEIKDRLDIVEVIAPYVPSLKKTGRNFKGLCPFHQEKTPSFIVFPDSQRWYCFGACATGGDIFTFIQKIENVDFGEALKMLAQRAGVELAPRTPQAEAEAEMRQRLYTINAAAAQYFAWLLKSSPVAQHARDYVAKRSIRLETVDQFQLGYAADSWDALIDHLSKRGYSLEDVRLAGLIIQRDDRSGYYDRFRNRLMFPICDLQGRVIGFGARALDDSLPKYLNSPQTPLFEKGAGLYGIDLAKDAIRKAEIVVVVEGYMDVVTAHQAGYTNVVASLGTALTESQLKLAKRFARRIVLALDADVAGSEATLRGLEVAHEALDRTAVPVPTASGLIRYESRLDVDLRILVVPSGKDPDDLIKAEPERWPDLVAEALPVVDYYFEALVRDLDLSSSKGKALASRRLIPVIQEIGDRVEQAHYVQRLAQMIRIDEGTLWEQLRGRRAKSRRPGQPATTETRTTPFGLEEYLLTCLLRSPMVWDALQKRLATTGVELLGPTDFDQADNRQIFLALETAHQADEALDPDLLADHLDEAVRPHLARLMEQASRQPPLADDQWAWEAGLAGLRLRLRNRQRQVAEIRFLLADVAAEDDSEAEAAYRTHVNQLTSEIERLQTALQGGVREPTLTESKGSPAPADTSGAAVVYGG